MTKSNWFSALCAALLVACGTTPLEPTETPDTAADVAPDTSSDVATDAETDPSVDPAEDVPIQDAPVDDVIRPRDVPSDRPDAGECPEGPEYFYESDDPGYCAEVGLTCEFPGDVFSNPCGCGCYFPPIEECPFDELGVLYQEVGASPEECATIFFGCEEGGEPVEDDCGCGCVYGPPVCLDPNEPGVSYVGGSPDECAVIDFDCGGADYFNNPCGCGCIETTCEDHGARDYVARTAEECALIDYLCAAGWDYFETPECGCGCEIPECQVDKFLPPSGLAGPVETGTGCDFLVACSQFSLDDGGTSDPFMFFYPDAVCRNGTSGGCPRGTEAYCEVPLGTIEATDMVSICAIAAGSATTGLLCSGDL